MIKAVIFDFDGVVVDSEPLHHRAMIQALTPRGIDFSYGHYLERYLGFDDRESFQTILDDHGLSTDATDPAVIADLVRTKGLLYLDLLARGIPLVPSTVDFLLHIIGSVPVAIASGATRQDIFPVLEQLDLTSRIPVLVTADDVERSKPDPATYRLAYEGLARRHPELGLLPSHCLAIEDSPQGIEAAKKAGLWVLALTTTQPSTLLTEAHAIRSSLKGFALSQWVCGSTP
jgi:beta-phosphoglucomutase